MKKQIQQIRKFRVYSPDFKRELVDLFESGKFSVCELERMYGICNATLYSWIYKFSKYNVKGQRVVEKSESYMQKLKDMERKIKELEQKVGQKQIMIDYLETMMEVAKEEYNIDIKKNFSTKPSGKSKDKPDAPTR